MQIGIWLESKNELAGYAKRTLQVLANLNIRVFIVDVLKA